MESVFIKWSIYGHLWSWSILNTGDSKDGHEPVQAMFLSMVLIAKAYYRQSKEYFIQHGVTRTLLED